MVRSLECLHEDEKLNNQTISNAARKAGVGVEAIRFYERKGLIDQPPKPTNGGYRVYPTDTIERIKFIRQGQELGFSLREIHELLSLRADPSSDCGDVRERAQKKLEEINNKVTQLLRIKDSLNQVIAACPGKGTLKACSIMDALAGSPPVSSGQIKTQPRNTYVRKDSYETYESKDR